jgi:hypothetical protein
LFGLIGFIPDQDEPKNLPMLCFRGASVLRRPYAQAADDIVIQVANRERRHRQGSMLSSAAMTAYGAGSCEEQCESANSGPIDPTLILNCRFREVTLTATLGLSFPCPQLLTPVARERWPDRFFKEADSVRLPRAAYARR